MEVNSLVTDILQHDDRLFIFMWTLKICVSPIFSVEKRHDFRNM